MQYAVRNYRQRFDSSPMEDRGLPADHGALLPPVWGLVGRWQSHHLGCRFRAPSARLAVLRVQGRQRSVVKMGGECSIADKSNVSLLALTNAATVTLILPVGPK